MQLATAIAVFFLIWWVVLFAVLPWGVRTQHDEGEVVPGTEPGAPVAFNLKRKLLWTTLVSMLVFAAFYIVNVNGLVTIEGLMRPFGMR